MPLLDRPDLLEQLKQENAALRAALLKQWESNHSEHCDWKWPHSDGEDCMWPLPTVLQNHHALWRAAL